MEFCYRNKLLFYLEEIRSNMAWYDYADYAIKWVGNRKLERYNLDPNPKKAAFDLVNSVIANGVPPLEAFGLDPRLSRYGFDINNLPITRDTFNWDSDRNIWRTQLCQDFFINNKVKCRFWHYLGVSRLNPNRGVIHFIIALLIIAFIYLYFDCQADLADL